MMNFIEEKLTPSLSETTFSKFKSFLQNQFPIPIGKIT